MVEIKREKDFIITCNSGTARGVFFRNPIRAIDLEYWEEGKNSLTKYITSIKNPVRRVFEILLGNASVVNNVEDWLLKPDFIGVNVRAICCPVYFKRNFRRMHVVSINENNTSIKSITSYGYDDDFIDVSGDCLKEYTKVVPRIGKPFSMVRTNTYYYTYKHIIKQVLETGVFKLQEEE